jgi:hypothetical protein
MPILQLRSQLNLHTRCENQIENEIDRRPPRAGDKNLCQDYRRQYPNGIHRTVSPTRQYNCHGLTFACRRTWIWKSEEIAKILRDDEYVSVELKDIAPGDVVVYAMNGDAEHSGIVIQAGSVPIILSKWGPAHEVIHRVNDCPYDSAQTTYYRINT